jgi:hypothetical protein
VPVGYYYDYYDYYYYYYYSYNNYYYFRFNTRQSVFTLFAWLRQPHLKTTPPPLQSPQHGTTPQLASMRVPLITRPLIGLATLPLHQETEHLILVEQRPRRERVRLHQ